MEHVQEALTMAQRTKTLDKDIFEVTLSSPTPSIHGNCGCCFYRCLSISVCTVVRGYARHYIDFRWDCA